MFIYTVLKVQNTKLAFWDFEILWLVIDRWEGHFGGRQSTKPCKTLQPHAISMSTMSMPCMVMHGGCGSGGPAGDYVYVDEDRVFVWYISGTSCGRGGGGRDGGGGVRIKYVQLANALWICCLKPSRHSDWINDLITKQPVWKTREGRRDCGGYLRFDFLDGFDFEVRPTESEECMNTNPMDQHTQRMLVKTRLETRSTNARAKHGAHRSLLS